MTQLELCAPKGKFRSIGVDTFDDTDWIIGDFDTKEAAFEDAQRRCDQTQMLKVHVYDENGKHLKQFGKF